MIIGMTAIDPLPTMTVKNALKIITTLTQVLAIKTRDSYLFP